MMQHLLTTATFWCLTLSLAYACLGTGCTAQDAAAQRPVRVALPGQPTTLDPALASDSISSMVLSQLHEGLTRHDASLHIQPALAKSWTFSDDYKTITFTLREDAKWSDGEPVRAQDFVYAWRRLLNPQTKAEYAYFLYDITGAEAYNTGKGTAQQVGVSAPDDRHIKVTLNRPAPYFPHIPSFMVTYPVREDVVAAHGDLWTMPNHMVTSGPFVLQSHQRDYRMVLTPNQHYALGEVKIDRLEMYQISEKSTALNLFVSGHLDVVLDLLPLAIPSTKAHPGYYNGPKLEVRYVGFRMDRAPMNDARIRQALSLAVDRSQLPRVLRGGELETNTWLPPGMFGHAADVGPAHDPEGARARLSEAGFPDGKGFPKLTLLFRAGDDWRLMAENLQEQWREVLGIEVTIQVRDQKVFFQEIDDPKNPPPMHLARWIADFPDPENFMGLFKSGSGNNALGFTSPLYDDLIDQAVKTDDRAKRLELYTRAQAILLEEQTAMAPLYVNAQNHLVRPGLKGLEFNAMGDLFLGPVSWSRKEATP